MFLPPSAKDSFDRADLYVGIIAGAVIALLGCVAYLLGG